LGYTIDIDTGGTFTDGFFAYEDQFRAVKTPTTPHDLTICFLDCIKAGAAAFGFPVETLLNDTEVIRFSNTIGTNCLINRDGSKVGLLVTAGFEKLAPTVDGGGKTPLVEPDMVFGIKERAGAEAPSAEEVVAAAQTLVDRGARCLVVAFSDSESDPANERAARAAIKREYPREYLGAVPVFLASDISSRSGYQERLHTATINAYIHGKLARLLYRAGEDLRRLGFPGQLLIGHNNGSVARVPKTRPINTYNSGPAAGLLGAREIGALYGADVVLSADMGGTSFDIGLVSRGEPNTALRPDVEGFRCNLPMLAIRAVGAGGGSIASVVEGSLRVGPQSVGALPGPACFGLGGTEATVTDANLVLGLLDPNYFLGGAKKLDMDKARAAIKRAVADPLGISVEEAAWDIVYTIEATMGRALAEVRSQREDSADTLMVVYGGGGPLHSCHLAAQAKIKRIVITPFSAVFSAYSSSLMDIGHLYHHRANFRLAPPDDMDVVEAMLGVLRQRAEKDMRGEGVAPESLHWTVELIIEAAGGGAETKLITVADFHRDHTAMETLTRAAAAALGNDPEHDLIVTSLGLCATAPVAHYQLQPMPVVEYPVTDARKGVRRLYSRKAKGWIDVDVYNRAKLGHGHALHGPAYVESDQTTVYVPADWSLSIDRYNNILLEGGA